MKRPILVVSVACLATAIATFAATQYPVDREAVEEGVVERPLRSTVLGEQRRFLVRLPVGYEEDTRRAYPVVYVLDGSSQDGHTASSASTWCPRAMLSATVPESTRGS